MVTPFQRDLDRIARNRSTRLQGAFEITSDGIAGHFARFFERFSERADFRDRGTRTLYPPSGRGSKIVVQPVTCDQFTHGQRAATAGSGSTLRTCDIECHRIALFFDNVANRMLHIVGLEQPASAPVARPAFTIRSIEAGAIQQPAGVGFEIVHYAFGRCISGNDHVDMVRADVGSSELPSAIRASLDDRVEYDLASRLVELVGALVHQAPFREGAVEVLVEHPSARDIVLTVDGHTRVTVHVSAVAGEGD